MIPLSQRATDMSDQRATRRLAVPRFAFPWYLTSSSLWMSAMSLQGFLISWMLVGTLQTPADRVGFGRALIELPGLVILLLGGILADRTDGRRLLIGMHLAIALPSIAIALRSAMPLLSLLARHRVWHRDVGNAGRDRSRPPVDPDPRDADRHSEQRHDHDDRHVDRGSWRRLARRPSRSHRVTVHDPVAAGPAVRDRRGCGAPTAANASCGATATDQIYWGASKQHGTHP